MALFGAGIFAGRKSVRMLTKAHSNKDVEVVYSGLVKDSNIPYV